MALLIASQTDWEWFLVKVQLRGGGFRWYSNLGWYSGGYNSMWTENIEHFLDKYLICGLFTPNTMICSKPHQGKNSWEIQHTVLDPLQLSGSTSEYASWRKDLSLNSILNSDLGVKVHRHHLEALTPPQENGRKGETIEQRGFKLHICSFVG